MVTSVQVGQYGRIGNQLFQVAACLGYANHYRDEMMLPNWHCTYTGKNMDTYFKYRLPYGQVIPNAHYQEPHFQYAKIPFFGRNRIVDLRGYYQSEQYFSHCADLVRQHFEPTDAVVSSLLQKYGDLSGTCSIHVRRGDYVGHFLHEVADMNYYRSAQSEMERLWPIKKYLVFSDDIDWCRQNFVGNNFEFAVGNQDIEDLFLMSKCENHIITNSSFSWWGSWLNPSPNKVVIAPSKWFKGDTMNDNDVYTTTMIKL